MVKYHSFFRASYQWAFFLCLLLSADAVWNPVSASDAALSQLFSIAGGQGALLALDPAGRPQTPFPLRHTDVRLEVSGFVLRAQVTQEFGNPHKDTIEALYTFPLPQRAAIHGLTLTVGDRVVRGKIVPREEAHALYEAARRQGQVAGMLDQERPNIFTQAIANILPGERVTVTIEYVELLAYEDGSYEVVFPAVVGPRYIPGVPSGRRRSGGVPDTDQVPDASRVTPPVAQPGTRAGHDLSIQVRVDAGVPLETVYSPSHDISIERPSPARADIRLTGRAVIPNKDFIVRYSTAGKNIRDAVLFHGDAQGGYFAMILQPPARVAPAEVLPKELVFVLDTSGSMSGVPIEKAKETMQLALDGLYPQDRFNLITFSGDTHVLFPEPVQATADNLRKAKEFLASHRGRGGTEMMEAIRAALEPSDAQDHVRIVCFMTDGFVGNDYKILAEIQKHPKARVFSFGIGTSVNRFLLDKMAETGRGAVEYVGPADDAPAASRRFHERVRNPLLADIAVDWQGLSVSDVYPKRLSDLFSAKPLILTGRYSASGAGSVRVRGRAGSGAFVREIPIVAPVSASDHAAIETLWARAQIEDLTAQDYDGQQAGRPKPGIRQRIQDLGLAHGLVTAFTSFVAVEEMTVTDGGEPRRLEVPVELPEGVSYEGVFGGSSGEPTAQQLAFTGKAMAPMSRPLIPAPFTPPCPECPARETESRKPVGPAQALVERLERDAVTSAVASSHPLHAKLHPAVMAVVSLLEDKSAVPALVENQFVRKGVAEVHIWLTDTSAATLAALRQSGVTIILQPKTGKIVVGRLAAERLADVATLKMVRYIAPLPNSS